MDPGDEVSVRFAGTLRLRMALSPDCFKIRINAIGLKRKRQIDFSRQRRITLCDAGAYAPMRRGL